MTHNSIDTLIVVEKIICSEIATIVHTILIENDFSFDHGKLTYYWLENLKTNDEFDARPIEVGTREKAYEVFEQIKNHRTGGCIDYRMPFSKYIALIVFGSLDDNTIQVVKFYVQENIYKQERKLYDKIFKEIEERIKVIGIIQGNDAIKNWDEIPLIEKVISGDIDKGYLYKQE